jgi:sugar (pentulose or hexulose) kinase
MQTLLIGVEVGTSAVKAVLYDLAGAEYFSTRCAYSSADAAARLGRAGRRRTLGRAADGAA